MNALLVKNEFKSSRDDALVHSGQVGLSVNRELIGRGKVTVERLPCIHQMLNCSYEVIRAETARLATKANLAQLNSQDIKAFERLTASLVRLANLELAVKDQSSLDMESDETIETLVEEAMAEKKRKGIT